MSQRCREVSQHSANSETSLAGCGFGRDIYGFVYIASAGVTVRDTVLLENALPPGLPRHRRLSRSLPDIFSPQHPAPSTNRTFLPPAISLSLPVQDRRQSCGQPIRTRSPRRDYFPGRERSAPERLPPVPGAPEEMRPAARELEDHGTQRSPQVSCRWPGACWLPTIRNENSADRCDRVRAPTRGLLGTGALLQGKARAPSSRRRLSRRRHWRLREYSRCLPALPPLMFSMKATTLS